ncbi:acyltransferase [Sinomicrobium soli]|uniref:acyltransferase n=1 Tax=Sinomicrobium sp. N-1-3-6 TaxID=2219864 RepID=UPI000DCBF825|nr:acyltransferase [Sinomicrobium sp. N-1-3-6]RAV30997.1 hypothetical protein DN748_01760 [Sinomicrobium sp. N-1-3-6]
MAIRIHYFDVLRALAILAVISIHVNIVAYKYSSFQDWVFHLMVIWRQLINFAVPLFLSISGFFLSKRISKSCKDHFLFLKKQLTRVLIPFFIWSFIYVAIRIYEGENWFHSLRRIVTFNASFPFYFVALIVQYYLLLPYLIEWSKRKNSLWIALSISLFSCLLINLLRYLYHIEVPLIVYAGNFVTWLVFFVLGLKVGGGYHMSIKKSILFTVIFFILSLFETYTLFLEYQNIGDALTAVKVTSFLFSFFFINLLLKLRNHVVWNKMTFFSYMGRVSFGIFLSHMLALKGLYNIADNFIECIYENVISAQFFFIFSTLLICMLFELIFRKISPVLASKYLGF